jgi:transcriptional regulator with XRE-family HTH domain
MEVGTTVRFLRLSAGLKQSDLAARLGVSPNYISLIENNKRDPSLSFLRDLSDEFGVPLGLLFLDIEVDRSKTSGEERALVMRIKDLILEIERIRLQRHGRAAHGT